LIEKRVVRKYERERKLLITHIPVTKKIGIDINE
jgi:hypothetical protein